MEISNKSNETILVDKTITQESVKIKNCTDCKIVNCDFSFKKEDETMLTLSNCVGCVVSKCKFHDKDTSGLFIKIEGEKSKDNVIEGCHFSDFTITQEYSKHYKETHGKDKNLNAEPIRIGGSQFSGCFFNTTIRFCHFDHLEADVETVSIKSCGNVLENNKHEDCKSSFVIRHGGLNKIQNNLFIGSGGIRVCGDSNEIIGNYHQNNDSSRFPPLIISNGNLENDPNFDSEGKPSGKEGSSHAAYARAKNNLLEGNTYDNCVGTCVIWARKKEDQKLIPTKNKFRNNAIIADEADTDSTLLVLFLEAEIADNLFETNQLYGENAKRGDIPQEAIKTLSTRPEIKMPDVEPRVAEAAAGLS
jgi:Chondroitinase B